MYFWAAWGQLQQTVNTSCENIDTLWQTCSWADAQLISAPKCLKRASHSVSFVGRLVIRILPWTRLKWKHKFSPITFPNDIMVDSHSCFPQSHNYQHQRRRCEFTFSLFTERNDARPPAWLHHSSEFIFPGDFMTASRLNSLVKAKLIGNQSKQYGSTFTLRYVSMPVQWLATLGCCSKRQILCTQDACFTNWATRAPQSKINL